MEARLPNIVTTTDVTKLTNIILESSYTVLQVKSKSKTLKQPVYFLGAVETWSLFNIRFHKNLGKFWNKLQHSPFYKTPRSISKHLSIHINSATHYVITSLSKNEKYVFLAAHFLNKNSWHFDFLINTIFGWRFITLKAWGIGVHYCWNYGPSKLLPHIINHHLDQLHSMHKKM